MNNKLDTADKLINGINKEHAPFKKIKKDKGLIETVIDRVIVTEDNKRLLND